uniref:Long-chain fatty acid--CoA ligase n=1 Tax=Eiseniibacteriota bacterium TaxID=2212470 RepID=A0A832I2V0_UNCEI
MAETLVGIFLETVDRHRKPAQFMRRNARGWESISAERALADVESLALGLRDLGVGPGDRVALLSENRYEWPVTDLAVLGLGAVTVPIYPTLTAPQVRYILENCGAKVIVVSTPAQLDKIETLLEALPHVAAVVPMEPAPPPGPRERGWEQVRACGAELRAASPGAFRAAAAAVRADDLATIIYTSGTTGEPKGAMLTHGNIASNVAACLQVFDLNPADTSLSFLPLCHIFERMAGLYAMLGAGVTIAYAQNLESVATDAQEVKPTILTGVPRFYEKVYARVMENAFRLPPIRKVIFHWGLRTGRAVARLHFERRAPGAGLAVRARIADRLVGRKIRERVGGRIRYCISGGAPLAPKVMEFFFAVGIPVLEGYGLTETSPVICVNRLGQEKPGSVGPPVPGVEVRIGDDGEILTRGPHVMKGYFGNDEATRAAIRGGWFHTGDVGHLDADGYLVITDRLKDLLVTAGGKKVAPQPIEGELKASRWIAEAVLLGDRRPYVVALLVPNFVNLQTYAQNHGWAFGSKEELLRLPQAQALYQAEVDAVNAGLAPFETVKRFALLPRELSQEAGELTPTLKVRRRIVQEKFAELIESLYATVAAG